MKEELLAIRASFEEELSQAKSLRDLEDLRVRFLGKKGSMTKVMKGMGRLSKEERPVMGALANEVRETITKGISDKKNRSKTNSSKRVLRLKSSTLRFRELKFRGADAIRCRSSSTSSKTSSSEWASQLSTALKSNGPNSISTI